MKNVAFCDAKKELIKSTKTYEKLNAFDMNKEFPLEEQVKQQNIYIIPNVGKKLISVDLEKANFNVLKMIGLSDEIKANSYNELLAKFTQDEYYQISKKIRQVIFGDLNPSRQQRLQKYVINHLCKTLKDNGCILSSASSDEIIIQNQDLTYLLKLLQIQIFFQNTKKHFNVPPLVHIIIRSFERSSACAPWRCRHRALPGQDHPRCAEDHSGARTDYPDRHPRHPDHRRPADLLAG